MNPGIGDAFVNGVRKAAVDAAAAAFASFAAAAVRAIGDVMAPGAVGGYAASGGDALARTMATALATDLRGRIVTDIDTNGVVAGDAHVTTHLAAFAAGEAASPLDDVSAEHAFDVPLGALGVLEGSATITLKATCAYDAKTAAAKTSTAARITLAVEWSSEAAR